MKFFFADSVDTVDPGYDFQSDTPSPARNRQNEDLYPHEVLDLPPYDGILVSLATVSGKPGSGRYTQGQRLRLTREGAREFFRFPHRGYTGEPTDYPIMGDCGAFSYRNLEHPPYSPTDVLEFYRSCGCTHGVSPDHAILAQNLKWDDGRKLPNNIASRWELTFQNAREFLKLCREHKDPFVPIGVIQGWSPRSYARAARKIVGLGYDYIGLGGLAARPTQEVYDTIAEVRTNIPEGIMIHVFGFSRIDSLERFLGLGITSFDSTAPLLHAFKDDRNNYYCPDKEHYTAIRIPPLHESALGRRLASGDIEYDTVRMLESNVLQAFRAYAKDQEDLELAIERIIEYEQFLTPGKDHRASYLRTLSERPWEECPCRVCQELGAEVIVLRGLNRNKRRGYHNLYVFHGKLKEIRKMNNIRVPCIKTVQNSDKAIYSFIVNGKDISKFASVSRIKRNNDGMLRGYQRTEVGDHINEIKSYLEKPNSILPNSLVIAFNKKLSYEEKERVSEISSLGFLNLEVSRKNKYGLIVDGQQRAAALRGLSRKSFPISVIGFESDSPNNEREQFVLVNNTRPLPKSLIYELLPSLKDAVPPRLRKRQKAARILERLNFDNPSPFHQRIKTATSRNIETANIKDVSVLRMIENSLENGALYRTGDGLEIPCQLLKNFWSAVSRLYHDAWTLPPKKSRLTHGVGIISMGYIMDTIVHSLEERWKIPPEKSFLKELRKVGVDIPWVKGEWAFSDNMILPWNEIQNISRHIDLVTNFLIRRYHERTAV